MIRLQLHTRTTTLPFCVEFDVYLPECPFGGKPEDFYLPGKELPVLFTLHGGGGTHSEWSRMTRVEELAERKGLAVVCPTMRDSDYTNMYYGAPWFDWLTGELYDYVHAIFPLSRDPAKNFVVGQSMGGYGAIQCVLRHPELFACAGLFSSGVGILDQIANRTGVHSGGPSSGKTLAAYGPPSEIYGSDNDSYHLAVELAKSGKPLPKIYSVCGTEDHCYPGNIKLRDILRENGYDLTWVEGPGAHTWDFWYKYLPEFLDWLPL